MRGLGGKVAVVTGAGGGIGSAVSRRLAEEGAGVACTDVDVGAAEIVANEIRERGGRAIAIEHDVTRRESWRPPGTPDAVPAVALPEHEVERSGGYGVIEERETLLFVVPAPGTEGARVVLIRVRHLRS